MKPEATIVIPTFDHADTLYVSVRSAQLQTVRNVEIFIIGDGVPEATRSIVGELSADPRIRFFDNPKSPRHGEPYRHQALQEARGDIVCYLSDDDLYFPDHVEYMRSLLHGADFVNALPLVYDNGEFRILAVDLQQESNYHVIAQGYTGRFGLSYVAHTLEFYRRLPFGWHTTPGDIATDQYMWRQCLAVPDCRARSGFLPTVLRFPAPSRIQHTPRERRLELEEWLPRLLEPAQRERLRKNCLEYAVRSAAREMAEAVLFKASISGWSPAPIPGRSAGERQPAKIRTQSADLDELREIVAMQAEQLEIWQRSHEVQERTASEWERSYRELERRYSAMIGSPVWTIREKMLRVPVLGSGLKYAGRLLLRGTR
ncbi:MAG TPA: glycosyltransferase family 2 protein [Candidatus Obscuribacterales bacterium]